MINTSSERFNKNAQQYLTSEVHKMSKTIQLVHEKSKTWNINSICDIACGAGHFGISFKDRTENITAVDPSVNMLDIAANSAKLNGISNYKTVQSFAENIPLESESFDLVISRLAPHHFIDIHQAVKEMLRLTKSKGHIVIIDLAGYNNSHIDKLNHELELLHDPTHIKSYSSNEWNEILGSLNNISFEIHTDQAESDSGVSVKRWCEIASSGEQAELLIRKILQSVSHEDLKIMDIEERDSEFYFPIKTNLIIISKE